MKTPLKFITLRRVNRGFTDTSSLMIGGRTPDGMVGVSGNLEHNANIAPASEADRLALIAWLQSDECKTLSAAPVIHTP